MPSPCALIQGLQVRMEAWELEGLKSPPWVEDQAHHLQSLHFRPLLNLLLYETVVSGLFFKGAVIFFLTFYLLLFFLFLLF